MNPLEEFFRKRLAAGLVRQSLTTCSRWAETCRVMKEDANLVAWSHDRFPWLREMADSKAEENAAQKGAQLGVSEMLLNIGMFNNDVLGRDVLYVLPNQTPDASQFSAARFDPAIEFSPHLSRLYSDVKNVGHKRAGRANFYIRGSQSRAGLKSIPVAVVILDELEEMNQNHVPLAKERLSGQKEKLLWMASTPIISGKGINKEYLEGSQEHFYFPCPHCNRQTELTDECLEVVGDDPDSQIVTTSYIKCKECKKKLDHETKSEWLKRGKWVATVPEKAKRSFYINQCYSTTIKPGHIAASFLRAKVSEADEQEFYNSKMGMPHEVAGARITDEMINACKGDFLKETKPSGMKIVTMGIDVGRKCHYEVAEWTLGAYKGNDIHSTAHPKILDAGGISVNAEMTELDDLMRKYRVMSCVIDCHPDRRAAFMFSQRFMGYVRMCIYVVGLSGKQVQTENINTAEPIIKVDRTSWLDQSLGRFRKGQISIPKNIGFEYTEHLKNIIRIPTKDSQGNPMNYYDTGHNKQDHFAHARNYNEIALLFAASMQQNEDVNQRIF
jgi:hypothetical protein